MARQFGGAPNRQAERTKMLFLLGCAGIAVFGGIVFVLIASSGDSPKTQTAKVVKQPDIPMSDVLVPLREVRPGEQLSRQLFRIEKRPAIAVDKGTVSSFEEIVGQYAAAPLIKGVPLNSQHLTSTKPTSVIHAEIPPGYRAVTIRVNEVSSVHGWAEPGSKVDVSWVSRIAGKQGVTTIVQNAKVLSAERRVNTNNQNGAQAAANQQGTVVPSTVTLLVTASDAQRIQLAQTTGTLSLTLRGDADLGKADVQAPITIEDLLGRRTDNPELPKHKGTISIGGKRWFVSESGELIPATKRSID